MGWWIPIIYNWDYGVIYKLVGVVGVSGNRGDDCVGGEDVVGGEDGWVKMLVVVGVVCGEDVVGGFL